jgi:hypothetical protein
MKKLFFVLALLLLAVAGFSQPVVQRATNSVTAQDARTINQYNQVAPRFLDTTAANLQIGVDSAGAIIYSYASKSFWYRQHDPKKWVEIGVGGTVDTTSISTRAWRQKGLDSLGALMNWSGANHFFERMGIAITPTTVGENNNCFEPHVIIDSNPQILTSEATVFKMIYSSGWGSGDLNYAESADGINWTKYSSNPVIANHFRSYIRKIGDSVYLFASNILTGNIDRYTSTDFINWTAFGGNPVITKGSGGSWNDDNLANLSFYPEGGTWHLILEAKGADWALGYYTSTNNGKTWTPYVSNPVIASGTGAGGPDLHKLGSTYYMFCHVGGLPSDLAAYTSTDFINWSYKGLIMQRNTVDEGLDSSSGQLADPAVIAVDSVLYLYNAVSTNGSAQYGKQQVKVSIYGGSLAQLDRQLNGITELNNITRINGLNIGNGGGTLASNTTLGLRALRSNTTGTNNSAFGYYSQYLTTTGSDNTSFGYRALYNNTTGQYNTAIGTNALYTNISGQHNVAIGRLSLNLTTGSSNTAIGSSAGQAITTGTDNVIIGKSAMSSGNGSENVVIGSAAAPSTSGSSNVIIGNTAMTNHSSGNRNVAIGNQALYSNGSSSFNVAVGDISLYYTTGGNNTAIGRQSGMNTSSGTQNVFVGYQAGLNNTTGSNNIAIGVNVYLPSATASGQLNIQNAIYGTSNTGTEGTASTGNIGMYVQAPTARLHLPAGASTANKSPLKFESGTSLATPENGAVEYDGTNYYVTSGGVRYTVAKTLTGTVTHDFANTTPGSTNSVNITVTGAASGDVVILGLPSTALSGAGVQYYAFVTAADTVTIYFSNNSGSDKDPASGTYKVSVQKF